MFKSNEIEQLLYHTFKKKKIKYVVLLLFITNRFFCIDAFKDCLNMKGAAAPCESFNATLCVDKYLQCDNKTECKGGEDESDEICRPSRRQAICRGDFICDDKIQCVKNRSQCNGVAECNDKSDENKDLCRNCPDDEVKCDDKRTCVKKEKICTAERKSPCPDGSNVDHFVSTDWAGSGYMLCARWKCSAGYEKWEINGKHYTSTNETAICMPNKTFCFDLGNYSEYIISSNCRHHRCPDHSQKCSDKRQCVQKTKLCDGNIDCKDESDEFSCHECQEDAWYCTSADETMNYEGQCVKNSMRCDGKIDCKNSADEEKYNCDADNHGSEGNDNHVAEDDYKTDEDGEDTQTSHGEKRQPRGIFLIGIATFLILIAN